MVWTPGCNDCCDVRVKLPAVGLTEVHPFCQVSIWYRKLSSVVTSGEKVSVAVKLNCGVEVLDVLPGRAVTFADKYGSVTTSCSFSAVTLLDPLFTTKMSLVKGLMAIAEGVVPAAQLARTVLVIPSISVNVVPPLLPT